ncbi:hypothetical protein ACIBI9_04285 [Nonomuraea sp. NPDC050451]|uniref:hypothetical protein n=1 Tax=Nonomuraea sp. NPDC050451 TaxID=3364364 RepID=UPI003799BAF7
MTPEEVSAYYDDAANARAMCDLLMKAHPDWNVWREDGLWRARYETWPEHQQIRDSNAGMLTFTIRMGGTLS